jgi:hypothetical protein
LAHRCRKGAIHPIKPGHEGEGSRAVLVTDPTLPIHEAMGR